MNNQSLQYMRAELSALSMNNWAKFASADEVIEEIAKFAAAEDLSDEQIIYLLKTAGFKDSLGNAFGAVKSMGQKAVSGISNAASSVGSSVGRVLQAPATRRLADAGKGMAGPLEASAFNPTKAFVRPNAPGSTLDAFRPAASGKVAPMSAQHMSQPRPFTGAPMPGGIVPPPQTAMSPNRAAPTMANLPKPAGYTPKPQPIPMSPTAKNDMAMFGRVLPPQQQLPMAA